MGWHFAARKKTVHFPEVGNSEAFTEVQYELVEATLDENGELDGWTADPVSPFNTESKEAFVAWLRKAADDVEKYDVIDEDILLGGDSDQ